MVIALGKVLLAGLIADDAVVVVVVVIDTSQFDMAVITGMEQQHVVLLEPRALLCPRIASSHSRIDSKRRERVGTPVESPPSSVGQCV
jgi:hypothetical protein